MSKIKSVSDAVKLIPDNATVAVNSSSGLCCPDFILKRSVKDLMLSSIQKFDNYPSNRCW